MISFTSRTLLEMLDAQQNTCIGVSGVSDKDDAGRSTGCLARRIQSNQPLCARLCLAIFGGDQKIQKSIKDEDIPVPVPH